MCFKFVLLLDYSIMFPLVVFKVFSGQRDVISAVFRGNQRESLYPGKRCAGEYGNCASNMGELRRLSWVPGCIPRPWVPGVTLH